MNHTWGVYNLQGKLADGREVAGDDRAAVKWFVRWRVDGHARKRTFRPEGPRQGLPRAPDRSEVQGVGRRRPWLALRPGCDRS